MINAVLNFKKRSHTIFYEYQCSKRANRYLHKSTSKQSQGVIVSHVTIYSILLAIDCCC